MSLKRPRPKFESLSSVTGENSNSCVLGGGALSDSQFNVINILKSRDMKIFCIESQVVPSNWPTRVPLDNIEILLEKYIAVPP